MQSFQRRGQGGWHIPSAHILSARTQSHRHIWLQGKLEYVTQPKCASRTRGSDTHPHPDPGLPCVLWSEAPSLSCFVPSNHPPRSLSYNHVASCQSEMSFMTVRQKKKVHFAVKQSSPSPAPEIRASICYSFLLRQHHQSCSSLSLKNFRIIFHFFIESLPFSHKRDFNTGPLPYPHLSQYWLRFHCFLFLIASS